LIDDLLPHLSSSSTMIVWYATHARDTVGVEEVDRYTHPPSRPLAAVECGAIEQDRNAIVNVFLDEHSDRQLRSGV